MRMVYSSAKFCKAILFQEDPYNQVLLYLMIHTIVCEKYGMKKIMSEAGEYKN